jgi:quercetin dioxygenase-like cupin family protein
MDEDGRHTDPTEHPALAENLDILQPLLDYVRRQYGQSIDARGSNESNSSGYFVRMLFVKLIPGGSIPLHFDTGRSMRTSHRIHLALVTNDEVKFTVGNTTKNLLPGELWEINNRRKHTVMNNGTEGRVHMIMDFVLPGEKISDVTGEILEC